MATQETLEQLVRELPDPHTAQLLFERLAAQPQIDSLFKRNPALLSDVLTLGAWSPLLATTLENNPSYVSWLQRERADLRVRTSDELAESLGRFALVNSQVDPHVTLARFRRRELLRTYLHDIRRTRTLVETTEELSNLADTVLEYALKLSQQEMDNRFGPPQIVDSEGRISSAEFCVVALGKLGSCELNYASDIDLMFLFSADGLTAPGGSRGQVTNREYFIKLSERLLRLVSEQTGEGASYRIDVRLRPHGREGALASSIDEAVKYYETTAQDWELQTLIRSRAAAGSHNLHATFVRRVINRIYRKDISVAGALQNVRLSKQKIDLQREREEKGFNVKLGHGGIREIEFIAQALQLAFGGGDAWLRTSHTLISLGRLAERALVSEREHWQLSDAYQFLRSLEHRLQMEHGLQTHAVPVEPERRTLVARRMNFGGANALAEFDAALASHTANVTAVFNRVFGAAAISDEKRIPRPRPAAIDSSRSITTGASIKFAAEVFARHCRCTVAGDAAADAIVRLLQEEAANSLNAERALAQVTRVATSLDKEDAEVALTEDELRRLVKICGVSDFLGELFAGRPALIQTLAFETAKPVVDQQQLKNCINNHEGFTEELDTLRRAWSEHVVRIAAADAENSLSPGELNRSLTELAVATLNVGLQIAQRELARRHKQIVASKFAVLGVGRLGSGGMDYGSDLDVIFVYDSTTPAPLSGLTHEEAYGRLAELMITALSSITREGYLYRVDLRLRPDGQKGALAIGSEAFLNYVRRRAGLWEWLAYVKLRAVAGDLRLGQNTELAARALLHELAQQAEVQALRDETRRVRDRLEKEKGAPRAGRINIKHGAGGMLDVYFATRYLQLRDNVPDDGEDRTTLQTLQALRAAGSLAEQDFAALQSGYDLLRAADHQLRLVVGRSAALPAAERPAFFDIAKRLGFATADEFAEGLEGRMKKIREAYERILQDG